MKKLFEQIMFCLLLVPWLICLGIYMACYEVKLWFEWRGVKRRTYFNGVWFEE